MVPDDVLALTRNVAAWPTNVVLLTGWVVMVMVPHCSCSSALGRSHVLQLPYSLSFSAHETSNLNTHDSSSASSHCRWGELYYEGKEYETLEHNFKPGILSDALK